MNMFEFYNGIESCQSPESDAVTFDDAAMNRAEIQRIADIEDHNTYQLMEVDKLVDTIKNCGIDRSVLFMYNQNNELSRLGGVVLPSLEEFDSGCRVSAQDTDTIINNIKNHAGIIAMEGNMFGDYFKAYYDDFLKPFRAGWRWFQSMSSQPTKLAGRIEGYIENLKSAKRTKLSGTADLIALNTLKRHLTNKTTAYREEANKILKDLNEGHTSLSDAVENADRLREIRDDVRSTIDDIRGSTNASARNKTDLSRISISDYIKLGEQTIERLRSISKMNETYDGYWYTGYSSGKMHFILARLFAGIPAAGAIMLNGISYSVSVLIHRGVISTASVGWQVLTLTVDADMVLARAIAHNLREINDAV